MMLAFWISIHRIKNVPVCIKYDMPVNTRRDVPVCGEGMCLCAGEGMCLCAGDVSKNTQELNVEAVSKNS